MAESTSPEETTVIQTNSKIRRCDPRVRFGHTFFSIILALYGAGLLLMMITVRTELYPYLEYLYYYLEKPIIIMIVGSKILIGIGSFGFISSTYFIYQGIVTSGVFIFGLLLFKLSIGIVALATLSSASRSIKKALELSIDNYKTENSSIEFVQTNLYCCGVTDYTDWYTTLGYIPGSCCGAGSTCEPSDVIERSSTGCYEALVSLIGFYIRICLLSLAVLVVLEISAITVTFLLVRDIKEHRKRVPPSNEERENGEDAIEAPPAIPRAKNPMAVKKNSVDGNQEAKRVSPFPRKRSNESTVKLPQRRLASFNYPIRTHRIIPTAPTMPIERQRYPRVS